MWSRKRLFLGLSLVLIVVISVYVFVPNSGEERKAKVYLAKESIPAGEVIDPKRFTTTEVTVPADWMVKDLKQIKDKRAVRKIEAGRFIDENDFSDKVPLLFKEGEGEYAIKTKPEYANGGRVAIEDIVDVIFVKRPQGGANASNELLDGGEIVATDVTILSIRTQLGKDVAETKKDDMSNAINSVVLKVDENTATKLANRQEMGTLSLYVKKKGVNSVK
ncbi:hypothetical protein AV654_19580 [Paenibacillus elgii]|uniref:SAF domain-containing protein n=1 Tax=Paenibacillus elgii TaxID=189691 RepID=A0A161S1V6_9BACL|nr:RcpC/CpaB family pilus assembly protein [Paenibacillus elgii]KZE78179.1 hypothetical protein AV654_19580 [Paenibacillus elgii]